MTAESPFLPPDRAGAEPLADALRRAAADLDRQAPRLDLPEAVRAALRARTPAAAASLASGAGAGSTAIASPLPRPPSRPRSPSPWAPWTTAALCLTLLVLSALLLLRGGAEGRTVSEELAGLPTAFVPAAGGERWLRTGSDGAPAWLVRAELPRERLVEFGLPFDPSRAGEPVRAELLLRGDGDVLALRVLAAAPRQP